MEAADLGLRYVEILAWPVVAGILLLAGLKLLNARQAATVSQLARTRSSTWDKRRDTDTGKVCQSIADAETLIPMEAAASADPIVHLQQAVRIAPEQYRDGAREISEQFRAGRVVIVDLAAADESAALRFVDFSSGLTLGAKGTFFQVSSTVLLLTPRTIAG